ENEVGEKAIDEETLRNNEFVEPRVGWHKSEGAPERIAEKRVNKSPDALKHDAARLAAFGEVVCARLDDRHRECVAKNTISMIDRQGRCAPECPGILRGLGFFRPARGWILRHNQADR